jgi:decaprenyl-phosphate phosphoribosyltransferase
MLPNLNHQDKVENNSGVTEKPTFKVFLKALRVRQWSKNLIVFSAPLFSFNLAYDALLRCIIAFFCFCVLSNSFYLINDILDVDSDRLHPVKCLRPIASGSIKLYTAKITAFGLAAVSLLFGFGLSFELGCVLISYAVLQVLYNLKLKRVVILDVIVIAAGFVLRAYAGATATSIVLSPWFLLCTAMLAMFLGIEKRKAELRIAELRGTTRAVLRRYSLGLLNRMESTVSNGAVISYAIWSSGPGVNGASTSWMLITLPHVLYGVFRYQLLSDPQEIARNTNAGNHQGGKTESPEEVLLTDRPMLLTVSGWILTVLIVLILKRFHVIS